MGLGSDDFYGQLGNNSTTNSSVPVQVYSLSGAIAIAAQKNHSMALKADGTVWDWGDNTYGQLGNNSTTNTKVPVQVSGLSSVTAIAAGNNHSLAAKSDGTAWAWGRNQDGQLGNNTTASSLVPVRVSGLTGVVGLAGAQYHSLAVKSDGSVWSWGHNGLGQLGNGTQGGNALVPAQVPGIAGVGEVAAAGSYSLALKSDGTVSGWGDNGFGQLGTNSTTGSLSPVQSTMTNVAPSGGHVQATYTYDGDGLRVSKTVAGSTAHFAWDVFAGLPLLLTDGSSNFLYGPQGVPFEQVNPDSSVSYLYADQLGSTRVLANGAGAVTASYTYDAYANTMSHTGSASTPLLFGGQYQDNESGLYYLRARYYDPATAQFLSRDPMVAVTRSPYGYVDGDPLNSTDPSGEASTLGDPCGLPLPSATLEGKRGSDPTGGYDNTDPNHHHAWAYGESGYVELDVWRDLRFTLHLHRYPGNIGWVDVGVQGTGLLDWAGGDSVVGYVGKQDVTFKGRLLFVTGNAITATGVYSTNLVPPFIPNPWGNGTIGPVTVDAFT